MAEAIALSIAGMTCTSCTGHVKAALEKVAGVRVANVSYPNGRADIETEAGVGVEALTAAVATLGYRARLADTPARPAGLIDKPLGRLGAGAKRDGGEQPLHIAVIGSGGAAMAAALKAVEQGRGVAHEMLGPEWVHGCGHTRSKKSGPEGRTGPQRRVSPLRPQRPQV
ncbi:MAG: cation transporter [Betaproteobacteria bacterium]|nr:cation transporter [Betaproteobacteria bacterium]